MVVPIYNIRFVFLTFCFAFLLVGCEQTENVTPNNEFLSSDEISSEIALEWTQLQRTLAK